MIDDSSWKLGYATSIGRNFQWMLLYEFEINDEMFFEEDDKATVEKLINTEILNRSLYHEGLEDVDIEISMEFLKNGVGRPFNIENTLIEDFTYHESQAEFEEWIEKFLNDPSWKDDVKDAKFVLDAAKKEISKRTDLRNGLWHLSKDLMKKKDNKILDPAEVYSYYETFVEVDKDRKIIRTYDFGYD